MTKIDAYLTTKNFSYALAAAVILLFLPVGGWLEMIGKVLVLLVAIGLFIK